MSRSPARGLRALDWPRVLLIALGCAVVLALGVVAATSTAAFGPYNPAWDGATDFRDRIDGDPGVESHLVRDTAAYEALEAEGTVAFVAAPDEAYEGADAERLRTFVAEGGTLVVLENFGRAGNAVLAAVGADARADGRLLRDEHHHFRGPAMPVATGVANHTLTAGVDRLTLNHATAVAPGGATVLATTSDVAYLGPPEADLDDVAEDDLRAHPVATVESVGEGRVVAVGDPSIAINAMLDEPDNAAFLRATYADAERVVLDRSHAGGVPPLAGAVLTLRASPPLQVVVGALGIGLVAAGAARGPRSWAGSLRRRLPARVRPPAARTDEPRVGPSDAERAAILERRHPDWSEERIRRVITALNRADEQRTDE